MKIHEYQAKDILERYGVAVPKGEVANTLEEALDVAKKALQRGRQGCSGQSADPCRRAGQGRRRESRQDPQQAEEYSKKILGMQLVTHQTGPQGQKVQRLLIEETAPIARELYLGSCSTGPPRSWSSWHPRRAAWRLRKSPPRIPTAIFKAYIDPAVGFQPYQARKLAFALGLKPTQINDAVKFMTGLYKVFWKRTLPCWRSTRSSPPRTTSYCTRLQDQLRRQCDLPPQGIEGIARHGRRGSVGSGSLEVRAQLHQAGRQYRLHGQWRGLGDGHDGHHPICRRLTRPTFWTWAEAPTSNRLNTPSRSCCRIRMSRPSSSTFSAASCGCDTLAHGVVEAARKTNVKVPVVLRLEGTNVEQGRKILKNSGLNFIIGETMQDAAAKVVKAAKEKAATKK